MCSTEQSCFIWVRAIRRWLFVTCTDFQLLSILLLSRWKSFHHRMCGVPMCNRLAAGDALQKDANWLKHGGGKSRGQKWLEQNQKRGDKLNRLFWQIGAFPRWPLLSWQSLLAPEKRISYTAALFCWHINHPAFERGLVNISESTL